MSVVGFDDVGSAPFRIPSLTTIRQPLREMGKVAAESLLKRISHPNAEYPGRVIMRPELVIRESTAIASSRRPRATDQRKNLKAPVRT